MLVQFRAGDKKLKVKLGDEVFKICSPINIEESATPIADSIPDDTKDLKNTASEVEDL
jgi:hypothetical protein